MRCDGRTSLPAEARKPRQPRPPKPKRTPQDVAREKEAHARRMVATKAKQMARLATSLQEWMRKADRYARLAVRTDEEMAAEREARKRQAERRKRIGTRRIVLRGGVS